MEGFDDKEQEKQSKSISEKLNKLRQGMKDFTPEKQEKLQEAVHILGEQLEILQEKARLKTITKPEIAMLADVKKKMGDLVQGLQDTALLLEHAMLKNSIAYYNAVKEEAEKGNEEAQKVYEQLRPSYLEMLKENMDENRN